MMSGKSDRDGRDTRIMMGGKSDRDERVTHIGLFENDVIAISIILQRHATCIGLFEGDAIAVSIIHGKLL